MSQNIQPKLHFQHNTYVVRVMTRYHLQWHCLCLVYVNTDNELVIATLNKQTVIPVEVCSADQYVRCTTQKREGQPLSAEDLERFKAQLGITNHSVRFVYKLAKLTEM